MIPNPTPIYHITHISNLKSILNESSIVCNTKMMQTRMGYTNIAYNNIQNQRNYTPVPVEPFGTLHDYVPFYFAPRSPMLNAIYQGNVPGYSGRQNEIIYFVSTVQNVVQMNQQFVFTDGHGIMAYTDFFNDLDDLKHIDWALMNSRYWNNIPTDMDRKRRRQAEFLVLTYFDIGCVNRIVVSNKQHKLTVESELKSAGLVIPVNVIADWYF